MALTSPDWRLRRSGIIISGDVEDLKAKIVSMFEGSFDYAAIAKNAQERYNAEAYYEKIMKEYEG